MDFIKSSYASLTCLSVRQWQERRIVHGFLGKALDVKKNLDAWNALPHRYQTDLLLLNQVHGVHIERISTKQRASACDGDGWFFEAKLTKSGPAIAYGIKTADCLPVMLVSKHSQHRAVLHAGWKGVIADIFTRAVDLFQAEGIEAEMLEVAIGPSARSCCYQIGSELIEEISKIQAGNERRESFIEQRDGSHYANLQEVVKFQAESAGIPATQVLVSSICTICSSDFFSFRRDGDESGRQLSFIESF